MFKHITRYSWILCVALLWGGMQPAMATRTYVPPPFYDTPAGRVMSEVKATRMNVHMYGVEQVIESINAGGSFDGDPYLFMTDSKGTIVAHGGNKNLVGRTADEIFDALKRQRKIIPRMLAVASSNPMGGWVDYFWRVPGTDKVVLKLSYVIMYEGYMLGAGMHFFPTE